MFLNRSPLSPDVMSFYCQPSSIASYHDSVMSAVMICCLMKILYYIYKEPCQSWTDSIKKWTHQSVGFPGFSQEQTRVVFRLLCSIEYKLAVLAWL